MTRVIGRIEGVVILDNGAAAANLYVENVGQAKELRRLWEDNGDLREYAVEFKLLRERRTERQNRYMWALIREIDLEMNGGRSAGDWGVYCEALRRANVAYERVSAPVGAAEVLQRVFRAVERESIDEERGTAVYRCYLGSSEMNTQEMSVLIDTLLDMAAEVGIESAYWRSVLKEGE